MLFEFFSVIQHNDTPIPADAMSETEQNPTTENSTIQYTSLNIVSVGRSEYMSERLSSSSRAASSVFKMMRVFPGTMSRMTGPDMPNFSS